MEREVIKTPNEFRNWCSNLKPVWALDTETTSLDWLDLEMVGFSICDGTQACYVDIQRRYKKELLMILDYHIGEAWVVVMHNSPFDMMVLKKEGVEI